MKLPVHAVAQELLAALASHGRAVLQAPTGSGKSTQIPQILLDQGNQEGDVVVLQPRRLAARMLARRVAAERGKTVGDEVGYEVRHDRTVSSRTRIRYVTEGLFLRQLQGQPTAPGVGAVLLDEFHERHLDGDLLLALLKQLQQGPRPDLKLVVMSATLDVQSVADYLAAPVITSDSRSYPVTLRYLKHDPQRDTRPWNLAADALVRLLKREPEGDVLLFMPGAAEIRRSIQECARRLGNSAVDLLPLYGDLPAAEQDRAVAPGSRRKVIVATNVAETSLTIPGVRHVIDAGLVRRLHFDVRRGFNVLSLGRISRASAEQRTGRAGREAPGTCVRLWSSHEEQGMRRHDEPEIRRLDVAGTLLLLASLGLPDATALDWLDGPEPEAVARGRSLLERLGAMTPEGRLTPVGQAMARLPMAPRLGRLMVAGAAAGRTTEAALVAGLLGERDLFERRGRRRFLDRLDREFDGDLALLAAAAEYARDVRFDVRTCREAGIHAHGARQVWLAAEQFARLGRRGPSGEARAERPERRSPSGDEFEDLAPLLLAAYPDQVATRRSPGSPVFELPGGRTGQLADESVAGQADLVVAVEIAELAGARSQETVISVASPVAVADLEVAFPEAVRRTEEARYDEERRAVEWWREIHYHDVAIRRTEYTPEQTGEAAALLAERIAAGALELRKWGPKEELWLARTRCVAEWFPERNLLTYDLDDLRLVYQEICDGATRYSQVRDRPCLDILRNVLSWKDQQFVQKMAPERIQLPTGWRMRIAYTPGERPRGRAKIQDLVGLTDTPTVAGGRQPLLLEILAPNFRPVQTTDDLAGFWQNLYPQIRKQLSRRYPKHHWP